MTVSDWLRELWHDPRTQEVLRQVIVALLLALLSVLGYDRAVAQPRAEALEQRAAQAAQIDGLEICASDCDVLVP